MTYEEALKLARKKRSQEAMPKLANLCQLLSMAHAINPKLVYEGAVKKGLTVSQVRKLGPVEVGNLMFV